MSKLVQTNRKYGDTAFDYAQLEFHILDTVSGKTRIVWSTPLCLDFFDSVEDYNEATISYTGEKKYGTADFYSAIYFSDGVFKGMRGYVQCVVPVDLPCIPMYHGDSVGIYEFSHDRGDLNVFTCIEEIDVEDGEVRLAWETERLAMRVERLERLVYKDDYELTPNEVRGLRSEDEVSIYTPLKKSHKRKNFRL